MYNLHCIAFIERNLISTLHEWPNESDDTSEQPSSISRGLSGYNEKNQEIGF